MLSFRKGLILKSPSAHQLHSVTACTILRKVDHTDKEKQAKVTHACCRLNRLISNLQGHSSQRETLRNILCVFQVAEIQLLSSKLEVQNSHLSSDLSLCKNDKNDMSTKGTKDLELRQKSHDEQVGIRGKRWKKIY